MKIRLYELSAYMAPQDAFHIAHKPLDRVTPSFLHCHDFYEVFLVEAGRCKHTLAAGETVLDAGALVFVRRDDAHAVAAEGTAPCRIVNLMVRPETVAHLEARYGTDLLGRFFWGGGAEPDVLHLPGDRLDEARALLLGLQTGPRSLARIEAALLMLMTEVAALPARAAGTMPPWLAQACDAARRPDVFRRGAAGLVAAAGRGHEHVCRQMKRHLGLTPSAFVNRIRMEQAAVLLAQGEDPVQEIAAHLGIENMSHFHRLFRSHHGLTPRAWRDRARATPF